MECANLGLSRGDKIRSFVECLFWKGILFLLYGKFSVGMFSHWDV